MKHYLVSHSMIGHGTLGVQFEYRKGLESHFVDRMHPSVQSILPLTLLSWVRDQTRRSHGATDASITNPHTSPRAPTG
jgi:hypothetical protein